MILPGCLNGFTDAEVDLMADMSLGRRPAANWNVLGVSALNPTGHEHQLEASSVAEARGARVVALTLPHNMGIRLSFLSGAVLVGLPGWAETLSLPPAERLRALADPGSGPGSAAGAASPEAGMLGHWPCGTDCASSRPSRRSTPTSPAARSARSAAERGVDPFDALLDVVVADELRTGLRPPMPEPTEADWRLRAAGVAGPPHGGGRQRRRRSSGHDVRRHLQLQLAGQRVGSTRRCRGRRRSVS